MGRPATGRTTKTIGMRLKLDKVLELERRAEGVGLPHSVWASLIILKELKRRPGPGERARLLEARK